MARDLLYIVVGIQSGTTWRVVDNLTLPNVKSAYFRNGCKNNLKQQGARASQKLSRADYVHFDSLLGI